MPKAKRTIRIAILVVAVCLAGFITLRAVTPLEPRAQHTVRLCVDRPPVATKLFRIEVLLPLCAALISPGAVTPPSPHDPMHDPRAVPLQCRQDGRQDEPRNDRDDDYFDVVEHLGQDGRGFIRQRLCYGGLHDRIYTRVGSGGGDWEHAATNATTTTCPQKVQPRRIATPRAR